MTTVNQPACNVGWLSILGTAFRLGKPEQFGPQGLHFKMVTSDGHRGSIIVTQADHEGVEWIHASVAVVDRDPTYRELALLHRAVFGRKRWSYQVFAPADEHVNIHEHALHVWGRVDGQAVLPDFTEGLGSV